MLLCFVPLDVGVAEVFANIWWSGGCSQMCHPIGACVRDIVLLGGGKTSDKQALCREPIYPR